MKKIDNSTATDENEFTGGNPAVPTPPTVLPAEYMNVIQGELVKIVEMAGIALDQTGADKNQIAKALAAHCAGLDFYSDSGTANAYVLSVIGSGEAANTQPPAYFDGMRVRFIPGNDNTGASTVKVGTLAIKNIKIGAGAGNNPSADTFEAGVITELYYDEDNDCFKKSYVAGGVSKATQAEAEAETADANITADNAKYLPGVIKKWVSWTGTGTVAINDSYGVSSITDNGTGDYTVNFLGNMATVNYCPIISNKDSVGGGATTFVEKHDSAKTVSSIRVQGFLYTGAVADIQNGYVAILGDLA